MLKGAGQIYICITISTFTYVRPYNCGRCPMPASRPVLSHFTIPAVTHFTIPAVRSKNVTNKSCLVCVMSEKYASWIILRPQWHQCRRGEAEVRMLDFKTIWSEFHLLLRVGPKQLCALAHLGCTRTVGTS